MAKKRNHYISFRATDDDLQVMDTLTKSLKVSNSAALRQAMRMMHFLP